MAYRRIFFVRRSLQLLDIFWLFAVSSGLREFELAGNEVRHGNQVVGIAIASCLGFGLFPGSHNLNFSNRPVRTRMPGGVGGERSESLTAPYPDLSLSFAQIPGPQFSSA
ncbi:hypothetical protein L9S41_10205 [Geoalkalibacter halelectricus]|uniref:Uncharacterized protein n=1 Tax=Geoalkalibacter halelectricus TaxID=2847045 RepID=A0ABY5ZHA0_9BACT|nr:hypothetical protein [Geoalkalibacter halelectricus]UWZ78071.1 hypothetical protein L9S41_10205 [Geoalkalibacter halelectricus]